MYQIQLLEITNDEITHTFWVQGGQMMDSVYALSSYRDLAAEITTEYEARQIGAAIRAYRTNANSYDEVSYVFHVVPAERD